MGRNTWLINRLREEARAREKKGDIIMSTLLNEAAIQLLRMNIKVEQIIQTAMEEDDRCD